MYSSRWLQFLSPCVSTTVFLESNFVFLLSNAVSCVDQGVREVAPVDSVTTGFIHVANQTSQSIFALLIEQGASTLFLDLNDVLRLGCTLHWKHPDRRRPGGSTVRSWKTSPQSSYATCRLWRGWLQVFDFILDVETKRRLFWSTTLFTAKTLDYMKQQNDKDLD